MEHLYKDLGYLEAVRIVEVTLNGTEANVLLMDNLEYSNYKADRRANGYGGHTKTSPVRLKVPSSGNWCIVVDLGGYAGRIGASVRVL